MDRCWSGHGLGRPATIHLMIRFVRIMLGIVAAAAIVGWTQRALGLENVAGALGEAIFTAIALLVASLSDREFFYGTSPKRR
jgi:hypothetical protein